MKKFRFLGRIIAEITSKNAIFCNVERSENIAGCWGFAPDPNLFKDGALRLSFF